MPCQGAERPTKEEIAKVTDSVLDHLKDKYGIFKLAIDYSNFESQTPGGSDYFAYLTKKNRGEAIEKLKEAISEILWQENCEMF